MRKIGREVGYAVLAWLIPFVASVCLFPLKKWQAPLFDSLMGVVLAGSTVALGCAYLRRGGSRPGSGARVGLTWVAANWLLTDSCSAAGR